MDKKGIIYKVTHVESGKSYIGATTAGIEERKKDHFKKSKKGKAYAFQKAIATHGMEAFQWSQLDTASTANELAKKEKKYIVKYSAKEQGYNADAGGGIPKKVYQYDLDGTLVNTFTSLQNAANAVNAVKQNISAAATGLNKTCKGYVWKYCYLPSQTYFGCARGKRVVQIGANGVPIAEFESVAAASKQTGCNKTSIAKVCRGERKSCGGYNWKYN